MRRTRPASAQAIHPPQLPTVAHSGPPHEPLRDHAAIRQGVLLGANFAGQAAEDLLLEQLLLKRALLGGTQLLLPQCSDVRFDGCDLAASEWTKAHLSRAEFLGCRMVGMKLPDARIDHTLFYECNAELALFWGSTFAAVRFKRCVLRNALFEGANLAGVVFRGCDLTSADLRGTRLVGTDFRGSTIEGLQVGIKELQGAVIDPTQAVYLATLLGITVRAIEEPQ